MHYLGLTNKRVRPGSRASCRRFCACGWARTRLDSLVYSAKPPLSVAKPGPRGQPHPSISFCRGDSEEISAGPMLLDRRGKSALTGIYMLHI
ncbi:hypothetical protein T492DRAFT_1013033, partial [Pavlovales sp. CCMP2436]